MMRPIVLSAVVALGCEETEAPVADASTDSGLRRDADGIEPPPDAGSGTPDAGVVAMPDGGGDAGCTCPVMPPCMTGRCLDGVCVPMPSPDGSPCEDMGEGVCMLGMCVVSGCGDGRREGTELCDDGNVLDGDACSAMCEPTVVIVRHIDSPDYDVASVGGHRVASDLLGRLLFVWVEQHIEGDARLMGQRANAGGALEGDVIEIAPSIGACRARSRASARAKVGSPRGTHRRASTFESSHRMGRSGPREPRATCSRARSPMASPCSPS